MGGCLFPVSSCHQSGAANPRNFNAIIHFIPFVRHLTIQSSPIPPASAMRCHVWFVSRPNENDDTATLQYFFLPSCIRNTIFYTSSWHREGESERHSTPFADLFILWSIGIDPSEQILPVSLHQAATPETWIVIILFIICNIIISRRRRRKHCDAGWGAKTSQLFHGLAFQSIIIIIIASCSADGVPFLCCCCLCCRLLVPLLLLIALQLMTWV